MGVLTLVKFGGSADIEYLRILYKINDIYSRYDLDDIDLLDLIEYYHTKKDYFVEEIDELQNKCIIEWKNVLISLCNNLKIKIESKGFYTKLLKSELKQVNKMKIELLNENKTLEEYEDLFDNKLLSLRDVVESKIAKEENQNQKFIFGIVVGLFSAVIGIIISFFVK